MIPKSIVKIAGLEGISGIYLEDYSAQSHEIEQYVCRIFNEQWGMACIEAQKKYGSCQEYINDWPSGIDAYSWDGGVWFTFPALYLAYNNGIIDVEMGIVVLDNTLKILKDTYPETQYFGIIAFIAPNNQMVQRIFCSHRKRLPRKMKFVENIIEHINRNKETFIDYVKDDCYEYEKDDPDGKWVGELIDFLHIYEDKIDFSLYDQIMSATCDYIEDDDLYFCYKEKIDKWKKKVGYQDSTNSDEEGFSKLDKYLRIVN